MMKEKQYETIRVFFKIKDSEIHGGEDGYAEAEICLRANDLKNFRLQEYTEETAAFFAGLCKVPRENVEVIDAKKARRQTMKNINRKDNWIPVERRLPDNLVNPITRDAYVYPVTVDLGDVTDVRYYSFWKGHWYNQSPHTMDHLVIAWMPRPEPYRPENSDSDCFVPEQDNPYPLCVGKGAPQCKTCCLYKDMEEPLDWREGV